MAPLKSRQCRHPRDLIQRQGLLQQMAGFCGGHGERRSHDFPGTIQGHEFTACHPLNLRQHLRMQGERGRRQRVDDAAQMRDAVAVQTIHRDHCQYR